ncbi:branched-chain amino acid ABC transporter ATP-binding protein [Pandoraea terrae]|uniref:Branched-chain amino acid ABC transporter ATP-binding protein n=1 Tax=Pandoraea terrae TaxID=1537710 RepID=A0A5E4W5J6_9BURK|nr:ABC transporter ATP-binding protein [Pandoraea terrae]VVE20217.1 branched-chain amino acid ABC transporter ATP-binding protein [Pandoraea terrae]
MTTPLLDVRGLCAGYGEAPVLRGIDLSVARGEIVALIGNNGAGKTTLLRALSHVIASTGHIVFDGRQIAGLMPERVFGLGLVQVPEGRMLFDRMSARENLLMGAYRRADKAKVAADLDDVCTLLPRLRERLTQRAGTLSGGEQQMCAIGRALMAAPKLLMVDEMSQGLAPVLVDQLLDALVAIRKRGVTVLLVEQDVFAALEIADRGYVIETGEVVRADDARTLREDPEVRRTYLGL